MTDQISFTVERTTFQASRWLDRLGLGAAVVALIGGFVSFGATKVLTVDLGPPNPAVYATHDEVARLAHAVAIAARRVEQTPGNAKDAPIEIRQQQQAVIDLAVRQKRLEDAISHDPARALEIPLLRRDLDNMKESQVQSAASLKQSVDQVYDINKWLLGAVAISLLSLALSNFLKSRKSEPTS